MKPLNPSSNQRGLTLVELMIAIALAMFVTAAAIAVFLSSKQAYRAADALSSYQDNVRYALNVLEHDVRMAGQFGCANTSIPVNRVATPAANTSYTQAVQGYDSSLPTGLTAAEHTAGDILTVQYAAAAPKRVSATMAAANGTVSVTAPSTYFSSNDVLIIADCRGAQLFDVASLASAGSAVTITPASPKLTRIFDTDAEVMRFINRIYYIGTSGTRTVLMRKSLDPITGALSTAEEIADGIEDMRILYGVAPAATPNTIKYVPAGSVLAADWPNVVSARICLQYVSASNNQTTKQQTYTNCSGATVTAATGDLYQRFTTATTVAIRNRTL